MAAPALTAESTEYRVVLILPASGAVLTVDHLGRLPRVWIPSRTRITPRLHAAINAAWGVRGVVLDYLSLDKDSSPCAILELLSEDVPSALSAVALEKIAEDELSEHERTFIHSLLRGETTTYLSRIGWLPEAVHWVEETTGERILSLQNIEQLNAGGGFALLRFPMQSGRSYWLKATGEPNAQEASISLYLSELCPDAVPEVLGVRATWNAWLMPNTRSTYAEFPSDSCERLHMLKCAVTAMAELQRQTIGREAELFVAGAFDQRVNVLRRDSGLLFEQIGEAMSLQTSANATRIEGAQLRELHSTFDATCDLIETLAMPATLLHGDMNASNLLYRDGRCQFLDWSEAYIGFPFVTLQHLLLLNQPNDMQLKSSGDRALIDRYREVMKDICGADAMDQAVVCMPLIAVASALYGRGTWLRSSLEDRERRQVYVRTLARHMQQAAYATPLLEAVFGNGSTCIA
jgi:hypothetical protein